jgi:hypothetical protein
VASFAYKLDEDTPAVTLPEKEEGEDGAVGLFAVPAAFALALVILTLGRFLVTGELWWGVAVNGFKLIGAFYAMMGVLYFVVRRKHTSRSSEGEGRPVTGRKEKTS